MPIAIRIASSARPWPSNSSLGPRSLAAGCVSGAMPRNCAASSSAMAGAAIRLDVLGSEPCPGMSLSPENELVDRRPIRLRLEFRRNDRQHTGVPTCRDLLNIDRMGKIKLARPTAATQVGAHGQRQARGFDLNLLRA